jgi:hypothetical protein
MAHNKETVISTEGEEVVGNDANRFDAFRQSTTLGPEPATESSGPPEQNGGTHAGPPPRAS